VFNLKKDKEIISTASKTAGRPSLRRIRKALIGQRQNK